MAVEIGYTGRLGNRLFEYANARLFAEKFQLALLTAFPHPDVVPIQEPEPTASAANKPTTRLSVTEANVDALLREPLDATATIYSFSGFFQQSRRYVPYRQQIKEWLQTPFSRHANADNSVVLHLRADDYGVAHRIDASWFLDILRGLRPQHVYIVMSPVDSAYMQPLLSGLQDLGLSWSLQSGTVAEDFAFLAGFSTILCSNSTFAWWAAFLGHATTVYLFKPWLPIPEVDLGSGYPGFGIPVDGKFCDPSAPAPALAPPVSGFLMRTRRK